MIISASRRTDIPAFHADWFMERVAAGSFVSVNPFNPRQTRTISLDPGDVEGIVFWSKNPRPLLGHLDRLDEAGFRYCFQYTLNDYPEWLEPGVPPLAQRIDAFKLLADRLGPDPLVWRYDPIVISTATPAEWHLERLSSLAACLAGHADRLVISFLDFYPRVRPRLDRLARERGITFSDPTDDVAGLSVFAADVAAIAKANGLPVFTCCERSDLSAVGIGHGACLDGAWLQRIFAIDQPLPKDRNQRPECGCAAAVDMGTYGTCRHGCAYCYAQRSESTGLRE